MAPRDTEPRKGADSAPLLERALPSGRTVVLRAGGGGEDIEIRSAAGEIELCIALTDAGPVVSLRGARLEVDATDVAFRCRDFDVQASGAARLSSAGDIRLDADEIRAETKRDIHLNGAFIRLNCTPDGEALARARMAQATALTEAYAQAPAATQACDAHDAHDAHDPTSRT